MSPKPLHAGRGRGKPKSDEAIKFLQEYLKDGRKSSAEVHAEAEKHGIGLHTLDKISTPTIVNKKPAMGPEGKPVSYWTLPPPVLQPRKSKAAIREESIAFKEGYKRAINEILQDLSRIGAEKVPRKTAQQIEIIERLKKELRNRKGDD